MLTPKEIAFHFSNSALKKSGVNQLQLAIYGILGGAFIALGGALALMVTGAMPAEANPGLVKLLFGSLFPIGIIMVVVAGAELFTSDCAVMPLAKLYGQQSWFQVVRVMGMAFLFNFVGALLVVALLQVSGSFAGNGAQQILHQLLDKKMHSSFGAVVAKGIVANWLVCLAVWMGMAAKDGMGKAFLMWFPVMAFVAMGMEHSVANMFFFPMGIVSGATVSWTQFLVHNLLPATIGNIIGGAVFVALPYAVMFPQHKQTTQRIEIIDLEKRTA